jgi:pantoate--beta-alanine ligase
MIVITTDRDLTAETAKRGREAGLGGVLVPTMGALHEGHAALIRRGVETAQSRALPGGCTVSIFVNPTQFNDSADFARYPRTLEADLKICEATGAAAVFAPVPAVVYPKNQIIPVPPLPAVATRPGLEDAFRPGHFAGVCQVVMRLFTLLEPEAATFGEKDWQQLCVIRDMTRDAGLPIEIAPFPTVRAEGGLALSSRNRFLSPAELKAALAIPRSIDEAARIADPAAAEEAMRRVLIDGGLRVEYAAVRDARTLLTPRPERAGRALVAAWAGGTRLIDNGPWMGTEPEQWVP